MSEKILLYYGWFPNNHPGLYILCIFPEPIQALNIMEYMYPIIVFTDMVWLPIFVELAIICLSLVNIQVFVYLSGSLYWWFYLPSIFFFIGHL